MTVVCGKCRSPSLAGLCQHLPSAVSQLYLHVPGVLQSKGLYHLTEYGVGACVFMCVCVCVCVCRGITSSMATDVDISPPMSYLLQIPDARDCW